MDFYRSDEERCFWFRYCGNPYRNSSKIASEFQKRVRNVSYYLALHGHDPDEALLRRLRELTPWVQPLSQCRVTARAGVFDRVTGAGGVIVQVARLTWVHGAAADVVGGYYITHRHAAGLRYRVEPQGPDWAVTTIHLLWRA